MMQPAESLARKDATRSRGMNPAVRCSLPESKMRAVLVVIPDVFREQTLQMAFIHRNDVIQQVSTAALNPTLRNSILPGTFEGGPNGSDLQSTNRCRDFQPIFPIPVKDQKPGCRPKRKRLPQLLNDPPARRVLRDVDVQDAPPAVADDEEAIDHAEGDGWDREEIHRGDSFPTVVQKGEPALGWLGVPRRSFHPAGDRSLRDSKTGHEEFTMDARRSPGRVLRDHTEDQIPNLLGNSPPPCWLSDPGDPAPIDAKACSMPSNHCFWRDYNQSFFPVGRELMGNDPVQFVEQIQPWSRVSTFQNDERLPEGEILQDEMPMTTKRASKRSEPEKKQIEPGPELYQTHRWPRQ